MSVGNVRLRDRRAALELFESQLDLAALLARRLSARLGTRVDRDDLHQEALIGLWDAALRFDEGLGIKFASYAQHRIRGQMTDYLREWDWRPRRVVQEDMQRLTDDPMAASQQLRSLDEVIDLMRGDNGTWAGQPGESGLPPALWVYDAEPAWIEQEWDHDVVEHFISWWWAQKPPLRASRSRELMLRAWIATGSVPAAVEYLGTHSVQSAYQMTHVAVQAARRYGREMHVRREAAA